MRISEDFNVQLKAEDPDVTRCLSGCSVWNRQARELELEVLGRTRWDVMGAWTRGRSDR